MADVADRIMVLGYSPGWVVHQGIKTKTAMAHRMICGSFRLAGRAASANRFFGSWGRRVTPAGVKEGGVKASWGEVESRRRPT